MIKQGPWFWGSSSLFITPRFPEFDANTFVVSQMPVWVRLHNLPIHFWDQTILACIGNSIGRFIKMDTQRIEERIFTFARICVEVDLSKGLPGKIKLKHKDRSWLRSLDYENTAFSAEYVGKLDICKMHVQNTKRIATERRKQVTIKRDGNSPIQNQMRRKIMRRKNQSKMKATKQKLRRHPHKNLWNHNRERT